MELCDSDRSTSDDVAGKVELSMQKMIQHPGNMYPQVSKLRGTDEELQDEKGILDNATEDIVVHTPTDPLWPSGICSVIESEGIREGWEFEPAQPSGENKEEKHKRLPSSYCTIPINDELSAVNLFFNAGTERFIRDWRSGIVTVTVRDQSMRQQDQILGIVPLKLSDILQTSSQVTRRYPLDGGIGFGRIRISLLFHSFETRLPPQQLGWDVGTFEFTPNRILATGYNANSKLKLKTGGSSEEGDGVFWDIAKKEGKNNVRLPFRATNKRKVDAYAVDNFRDVLDIRIEEVGRLQFRGRFKAGMDEDRSNFVTDNDSRETKRTWEACHSEGVREIMVTKEMPPAIQELHDQSLTEGRDVLSQAEEGEKKKWMAKDGTDWSGAFGQDPEQYADRRGTLETKQARWAGAAGNREGDSSEDISVGRDEDSSDSEESDLGLHDDDNHDELADEETDIQNNKKGLHRKRRGLLQWKPMRNLALALNLARSISFINRFGLLLEGSIS
ncbi:hypothetical protein BGZ57DRAFT_961447 [Hyaloscypha finlandica]|nr:hypothetical protein BGZ57DRAFT_961447 [Hyaloscypha finlandica]